MVATMEFIDPPLENIDLFFNMDADGVVKFFGTTVSGEYDGIIHDELGNLRLSGKIYEGP